MKAYALVIILSILALSLASCQVHPELEDPDIRGIVEGFSNSQSESAVTGFILIVGDAEEEFLYDRALVSITQDTEIYQRLDGQLVKFNFSDLKHGMTIEAWFTGSVAESYPVQAEAQFVVILQE